MNNDGPGDWKNDGIGPMPWERQPGETSRAWAAFCVYRDLGPRRTLDEVDRRLYGPRSDERPVSAKPRRRRGVISDFSRQYSWVARCTAWDAEVDRLARVSQVEEVQAMNRRHVAEARALQAKALEALRGLAPGALTPADLLRFVVEASKLERLGLGEVTDNTRQEVQANGAVELVVVERIVPVRTANELPSRTVEALPIEARTYQIAPATDVTPADAFVFPDHPPAASLGG